MLSASFMRSSGNGQLACIALTPRGNSRTCRKNWTANTFSCSRLSLPSASSRQSGWLPKVRRASMRASRSGMTSSGASPLHLAFLLPSACLWRSVRPGLLVPGAIERRHSPADREELALRVHLAGDAMAQLIEERALETVGEEHAGVSQNEWRSLGGFTRPPPRPAGEPVPGEHPVDRLPVQRPPR